MRALTNPLQPSSSRAPPQKLGARRAAPGSAGGLAVGLGVSESSDSSLRFWLKMTTEGFFAVSVTWQQSSLSQERQKAFSCRVGSARCGAGAVTAVTPRFLWPKFWPVGLYLTVSFAVILKKN